MSQPTGPLLECWVYCIKHAWAPPAAGWRCFLCKTEDEIVRSLVGDLPKP